jgi:uridylate kinase
MNRVVGDHMGMLATVMNGLAMRDALHRAYVNARLMSAISLQGVCDSYAGPKPSASCAPARW